MSTLADITIIVELALTASAAAQATGVLLLDDVTFGLLDTGVLGDADTWSDVTSYVRSGTVSRPYTRQQGPLATYQAGTGSVVVNNASGDWDPDNTTGAFAAAGVSKLLPMVPYRIRVIYLGTSYPLWQGFTDSFTDDGSNRGPRYAESVIPGTDAFKILAGINVPTVIAVGGGEDTGTRISRILAAAGWYTDPTRREIATGDSTLQSTTFGSSALSLCQLAADSEIGEFYADEQGRPFFRNRTGILTDTRSNTVQCVLGDSPGTSHTAGTELPYTLLPRTTDDTALCNDVQATMVGGTLQEVTDTTSIATYIFPRTFARDDLILTTDADTLAWAQFVLYASKNAVSRFDTVQINPLRSPADLWPQVLGRQIGDRIQIWRRPPGVTAFSKDCFIRGIAHSFDVSAQSWVTTWQLETAANYSFLTLDDAILGALDSNALAFLWTREHPWRLTRSRSVRC